MPSVCHPVCFPPKVKSPSIQRTSWLLPNLGNCEKSCYKYPCATFCVEVCFQLIWVNTKELGKYHAII